MRQRSGFTLVELPAVSKRKGNAFTLVELLVVIGIVGVIVAMLMPALSRAREAARMTQCMSGARQTFMAVEFYCNDFDNYYPAGFPPFSVINSTFDINHGKPFPVPHWHELLREH